MTWLGKDEERLTEKREIECEIVKGTRTERAPVIDHNKRSEKRRWKQGRRVEDKLGPCDDVIYRLNGNYGNVIQPLNMKLVRIERREKKKIFKCFCSRVALKDL